MSTKKFLKISSRPCEEIVGGNYFFILTLLLFSSVVTASGTRVMGVGVAVAVVVGVLISYRTV